jgi:hypothetical protein
VKGNPSADAAVLGRDPKPLLCIYCQRGRHDQCVTHRVGFPFCVCPSTRDATEPVSWQQCATLPGSKPVA